MEALPGVWVRPSAPASPTWEPSRGTGAGTARLWPWRTFPLGSRRRRSAGRAEVTTTVLRLLMALLMVLVMERWHQCRWMVLLLGCFETVHPRGPVEGA